MELSKELVSSSEKYHKEIDKITLPKDYSIEGVSNNYISLIVAKKLGDFIS